MSSDMQLKSLLQRLTWDSTQFSTQYRWVLRSLATAEPERRANHDAAADSIPALTEENCVIPLCDAAAALHILPRTLRKKMAEKGLQIVEFSPNWRGVRMADLNSLIAAFQRPAA